MPTQCSRDLFGYEVVEGRQVVAAFDGGQVTSDPVGLLLGATDRAIGLVTRFAACFADGRAQAQVEHTVEAMVAQRVFGLALGYEDLIDHDQLRHDPVLAALAGKLTARRKSCAPLAGKSTLNRLEHAPAGASRYHKIGHAIESLFVALFLEAHKTPPKRIVLDLDATDDPLHGHQEGRFFHGYYDGYCYLPLYVFCGRHLLAAKLRRSNIDASAGALAEVERSGLEPDPRHYQAELAEEPNQRLRLTRHLGLSDHPSGPIHHTQAALFQRHVDPGIMLHGLSREDAWGRPLRTPFTSSL